MGLLVGVPLVRWFGKRDKMSKGRFFMKRINLHAAILIALYLTLAPFLNKPKNYFEQFNTIVSADYSTVYQQFRRTQTWIEDQVNLGFMDADLGESKIAFNERIHKIIHSPTNRALYLKFGDVLGMGSSEIKSGIKSGQEPSLLYCAGYAMNFVVWMGSLVALVCGTFLPFGGLLVSILILLAIFCLEVESRYVEASFLFFLNPNEWATFEVIVAAKQAYAGIVCIIVLLATLTETNLGEKTKVNLRNLLKSNAALVNVVKDTSVTTLTQDHDETYTQNEGFNIHKFVMLVISAIAIVSALLPSGLLGDA